VRKLDRYIVSTVAGSMIMVMMVVLSLDFIFMFIGQMNELKLDYQLPQALMYCLIKEPGRIYDYLPLGAFVGCLVGLGSLANSSELVVIRAAGVSTGRIVWSVMKPALLFVILGTLLGEYVVPNTESLANNQRAVQQGAESDMAIKRGLWHREGNTFMHFNVVQPNGVLNGVSLFTFDKHHWLISARFAQRAIYQRGGWLLENVKETRLAPERTEVSTYHTLVWVTELKPNVLRTLVAEPMNLSITGLYTYSRYLLHQDLNATEYLMAFWKKVLRPLTTAVMVLLAISFIFGPLRSVTMGFRVFCGIIVGLTFKFAQDLLGPSSLVFGFNPILATLIPLGVFTLLGIWLLKKAS
jgi:lipopolysaccharide export system permease protein